MRNLELRRLKYFLAVAEELHFHRAAEKLHMTQPPLSNQIRMLENELNIKLFERTSRSVQLTEAGQIFHSGVKRAMDELEVAIHAAWQAEEGSAGHLIIGFISSGGVTFLPKLLRHLKLAIPGLQPEMRQYASDGALEALVNYKLDLALVRTSRIHDGLMSETIFSDKMVVAFPSSHPLANSEEISLASLADESFILYPAHASHAAYNLVHKVCMNAGFVPRASELVEDVYGMLAMVSAGLGIALMPGSVAQLNVEGVVLRNLPEVSDCFELSLIWRQEETRPVIQTVIREICQNWAPTTFP